MDKQYKLTDRVSKDSIKSPIFKKWVKRILCIACIISLSLQLTLCCLPINASAADSPSAIGTWVFNQELTFSSDIVGVYDIEGETTYYRYLPDGYNLVKPFVAINIAYSQYITDYYVYIYSKYPNNDIAYSSFNTYNALGNHEWRSSYVNATEGNSGNITGINTTDVVYRTITITGGSDVSNTNFLSWLHANAVKQVTEVYDFTGETRIFNDELTLFNTTDATFTEAFSFDFEVLGVGTADYITLQRTTQNNYTMSYSFDFDDSGGLTMIYRDSPPFDNGEADWLGGKVNRKVIKFISNPEDADFQQWLLDNTTLFDDVNAAYQLGQQSGYNNGYEEGFANSLIGDSLSGPINALSQITLIEIQGTAITLGGVVMTAIALCLVLAFLKLYAGG